MTVKKVKNNIAGDLSMKIQEIQTVADQAYDYFRKITPKRTGNAQRKTRLSRKTIQADYPYAQRLNQGSSAQAPRGMSEPTIEYIRKITRKALK